MNEREIEQLIDRVGYDFTAFEPVDFVKHIEELMRRPVLLIGDQFNPEMSAAWIRTQVAHYILYNTGLHPVQQIHGILHEIGHILLGHPCEPIEKVFTRDQLKRYGLLNRVEGRLRQIDSSINPGPYEIEAEKFVFCLQRRVLKADRLAVLMGQSTSIERLRDHVDVMAFEI